MKGETDLSELLARMQPELLEEYAFCLIQESRLAEIAPEALGFFRESEGITIIIQKEVADKIGLTYHYSGRLITLKVHSDLQAVGFLSTISTALAGQGISTNVVSALFHDHLFVHPADSGRALALLEAMSTSKKPAGEGQSED